ncbi:recombinase family protein [Candidatus Pacearchaeota archaeon]|nr:recombinase family protein [Candidatus Pacearchaeota archaeon]
MVCDKCGYQDKKEAEKFNFKLCQFCKFFAPDEEDNFTFYINEKTDWKLLDTFRKYGQTFGSKQKAGMNEKAKQGQIMTRVALGYSLENGELIQNEAASKVHSIFRTFLEQGYSLNSMAKHYGLSVNGLKKILKNRTYLGEVKFDGRIHKGPHKPLITPEIFYAVQRRLQEISRKRKPKN